MQSCRAPQLEVLSWAGALSASHQQAGNQTLMPNILHADTTAAQTEAARARFLAEQILQQQATSHQQGAGQLTGQLETVGAELATEGSVSSQHGRRQLPRLRACSRGQAAHNSHMGDAQAGLATLKQEVSEHLQQQAARHQQAVVVVWQ